MYPIMHILKQMNIDYNTYANFRCRSLEKDFQQNLSILIFLHLNHFLTFIASFPTSPHAPSFRDFNFSDCN